jgi:hypothetical protein
MIDGDGSEAGVPGGDAGLVGGAGIARHQRRACDLGPPGSAPSPRSG